MQDNVDVLQGAWRAFDWVVRFFAVLACFCVVGIFLSVIFDVTMRYTIRRPPLWPVPITEYLLHIAVMFGAPYVLQQRGHVIVDAFLRTLTVHWRARLLTVSKLLCLVACTAFAALAWRWTWIGYMKGYQDVRAISVPEFILYGPMAICFTLMAIEFLRSFFVISAEALGGAADV
jgi:TRAP-type C4-dicarboxylate transport system permease small subunit